LSSVSPTAFSWSNATVYPYSNPNEEAFAPHSAHRIASSIVAERLVALVHRPRRGRHTRHLDVADVDRHGVADFGALDADRAGDLVAAAERRRHHRPPTPRRRVRRHRAAVGDGAGPLLVGPDQPERVLVDVKFLLNRLL